MYSFINDITRFINEETTSANIAFLPSGFTSVESMFKKLARKKTKWGATIIDSPEMYEVKFEDALRVQVQKEHWDEFNRRMNLKLGEVNEVDFTTYLEEAKTDDMNTLWGEVEGDLWTLLEQDVIVDMHNGVETWMNIFGGAHMDVSKECALDFDTIEPDMELLIQRLHKEYQDDRGGLEMLSDALENKRPLRSFDVFSDYDRLIGSRVETNTEAGKMVFEAFVDTMLTPGEHIYVDNPAVLEQLENEGVAGIKVTKRTIYPVGNSFNPEFFQRLRRIINDMEG